MLHGFLKKSTASQSRLIGPFIDDTDFKTVETALTIANTDVKLSKNGAAGVNKNSGGGTHRNNGMYSFTFNATDTNTVGELEGSILVAGALIVVFKFTVLTEAIYDSLFGASAAGFDTNQRVNVGKWIDTAVTLGSGAPDINIQSSDDIDLTATQKASVNAEADTALSDIDLDHLLKIATGIPTITSGTFLDQIMDDGTATFDRTTDSLQAIGDRGDISWITGGGGGSDRLLLLDTTIATVNSQTDIELTAGSTDDTAYENCTIVIEDASTTTQKAVGVIITYTGASKNVILREALSFTIVATDKVYILAENSLKSSVANRRISVSTTGQTSANIVAINSDTAAAAALEAGMDIVVLGSIDTTSFTPTTTEFETDITIANPDILIGRLLTFRTGTNSKFTQVAISDYALVGGRGHITVATLPSAPASGNTLVIM